MPAKLFVYIQDIGLHWPAKCIGAAHSPGEGGGEPSASEEQLGGLYLKISKRGCANDESDKPRHTGGRLWIRREARPLSVTHRCDLGRWRRSAGRRRRPPRPPCPLASWQTAVLIRRHFQLKSSHANTNTARAYKTFRQSKNALHNLKKFKVYIRPTLALQLG